MMNLYQVSKVIFKYKKRWKMNHIECAYHMKQYLTNFCQCSECLLPVCPSCIRLHTQQHKLHATIPKFQQINNVYNEIKSRYMNFEININELSEELIRIEHSRKQNQNLIKRKMQQYKSKLMREIDRYVKQLQYNIMKKISLQDENFITELQEIDDQVFNLVKEISNSKNQLEGQQCLRQIIMYHSQNYEQKLLQKIQKIKDKCVNLGRKSLYISFDERTFDDIQQSIKNYINVQNFIWSDEESNRIEKGK